MSSIISNVTSQYKSTKSAIYGAISSKRSADETNLVNMLHEDYADDYNDASVSESVLNISGDENAVLESVSDIDSESDSDSDLDSEFDNTTTDDLEFVRYFNSDLNGREFLDEYKNISEKDFKRCSFCLNSKSKNHLRSNSPVNIIQYPIMNEKPKYKKISGYVVVKFSYACFVGHFDKKTCSGNGVCYQNDGIIYAGHFDDYCLNGIGSIIYPNGERFEGTITNNLRNGPGYLYKANGNIIEGIWVGNKQEGRGILHYKDGSKYESIWSNDTMGSQGIFMAPSPILKETKDQ